MTLVDEEDQKPLIDQLEDDQKAMILRRLGDVKVKQIMGTITDEEIRMPDMAGGDKTRATPRMSYPVGRFYQACLREMGPVKSGRQARSHPPTPANAWLEITTAIDQGMLTEPTFSHPYVSDTVRVFRGWSAMWAEFNKVQGQTARGRFIMAYKDILAGVVH